MQLVAAYRGAVIGLLLAIGWDTSSQTATLEGGHGHLTFGAVIVCGVIGAIGGLIVAGLAGRRPPKVQPPG